MISLTCPRAGQAVDFVDLPSCRAGTYFRYAAKVSKGASKERGKPFGAVSLSPLKSPLLSTDRGTPPHGKRAGAHAFKGEKAVTATLAWLRFEALTARELVLEFDCVRFLAADALGASAGRPNRGYATGRCPASRELPFRNRKRETPHACRAEAVRDSAEGKRVSKGKRETARKGFPFPFGAPLLTFAA